MWIFASLLSLLADNLILTRALGTSTLMAATKNRSHLVILSLMMTVFSALGCLMTNAVYRYGSFDLVFFPASLLRPLLYTAVISIIYIIVLLVLHALSGSRFAAIRKYVHLSAFNCAVMGALYLGFSPEKLITDAVVPTDFLGMTLQSIDSRSLFGSLLFGVQMGLGFALASLMLLAVRKRLYSQEVPEAFRGFPAVLVYLGLISMAIYAITV